MSEPPVLGGCRPRLSRVLSDTEDGMAKKKIPRRKAQTPPPTRPVVLVVWLMWL